MKKHTCSILSVLFLLAHIPWAYSQEADQPVSVTVNGIPASCLQPGLIRDGRLYLSQTALSAELGIVVHQETSGAFSVRGYDTWLMVRPDTTTYTRDKQRFEAAAAPFMRGEELYVPALMLMEPFGLAIAGGESWTITTSPAAVTAIRQGVHPEKVRIVVDLTWPAAFRQIPGDRRLIIEFPAEPAPDGAASMLRLHSFDDPLCPQVSEARVDGTIRLTVTHTSPHPPQVLTLADPPRIVIDLLRAEPLATPAPAPAPAPGPTVTVPSPPGKAPPALPPPLMPRPDDHWRVHQFTTARGVVKGYAVRLHPQNGELRVKPALAGATINSRSTVDRIARRERGYAAINGGFFSSAGQPLGLLIIDGEWIKAPLFNRAAFGVTQSGRHFIRRLCFNGGVEFEGRGFLPVEAINQGHDTTDAIVIYTERWGPLVTGAQARTRLAVSAEGIVESVVDDGRAVQIPPGGYVLSGIGRRAQTLKEIEVGTKVTLNLKTNPDISDLRHAVGGGPILATNGTVNITAAEERFRADINGGPRPRSAIGLSAEGEVIMLVIENPGVTLRELAGIMIKLGAKDAMNLDGGGSSTMVVQDIILNVPGDGQPRSVSNALVVVRQKQEAAGSE